MKRQKVYWGLLGFGALALLCSGALWVRTRLSPIVIPPRQYPPNNAYDAYKRLASAMEADLRHDRRFNETERMLLDERSREKVSQADRAYYLNKIQPYLQAYRELLDQPCVAVYEYDVNWLFPELANFRQLARAEAVMIRDALERNQPREAAERAAAQLRFAEQIRNEGLLLHYLVGTAIMATALSPLREHLSEINDPVALQTILDMARRYERERNPISEAMQSEYYFGLSIYRDLRAGRYKLSDIAFGQGRFSGNFEELLYNWGLGVPLMLGASRREYEQIWAAKRAELAKPFWERKAPAVQPRRYINQILDPTWERPIHGEAAEVAIVRLLGCAAAIKLHKQRTGDYPASLDALNLGDMMIDPFTGKPFVYRRDPKKGFLLYSVGVNRLDDGGRAAFSETEGGDIAPVQPPPAQRPKGRGVLSAPLWVR